MKAQTAVPILVYHRFGSVRRDAMTVTTEHFKQQMELLRRSHYVVVPLEDVIAWRLGKGPAPAPGSLALTFDDGHRSVYDEAREIVQSNHLPVTLFIYPSCISRTNYAMTWEQLSELTGSRFFTVQSHTYWHPNFQRESAKQTPAAYSGFVNFQLRQSKVVLENRLKCPIDFVAWPFGIYDAYLMEQAKAVGYQAGFSIDCRAATARDPMMAIPRCLVSDDETGPRFIQFLESALRKARYANAQ